MEAIKAADINVLQDLLDIDKLAVLQVRLLNAVSNLIIREQLNLEPVPADQRQFLLQCYNPDEWARVSTTYELTKRIKKYNELQDFYASSNHLQHTSQLLQEKFNQLCKSPDFSIMT